MKKMKTITDIFGNTITVDNVIEALNEQRKFANFSLNAGKDDFIFDEFKFKDSIDIYGKSFKYSEKVPNGMEVKSLLYYQHNVKELLNLIAN